MATYTHAFINKTGQTVTIEQLRDIINGDEDASRDVAVKGFLVVCDLDRVVWDRHGHPSRNGGGWSYGHIQNGWICAGAGGVNSLRVLEL